MSFDELVQRHAREQAKRLRAVGNPRAADHAQSFADHTCASDLRNRWPAPFAR